MLIKVDLEKTYDKISRDFIKDTLIKARLPEPWTRNIMCCIETSKMSIVWNGKNMEGFRPTRGIRQGDSVSPYLFVLCMERLGHILTSLKSFVRRKPIPVFDPRPLYWSSLTTAVGGTKDTNFVDSGSPYRGMNQYSSQISLNSETIGISHFSKKKKTT